jgi:hypothetical protein
MRELLKWGAMAAGAYLIYQQLTGGASAFPSGTPATEPATTPALPPVINATTRQLLVQATGGGAPRSFHQWNWHYALPSVRGVQGPAPESVGMGDGVRTISVDEYLAAIGGAGLSGWGRW